MFTGAFLINPFQLTSLFILATLKTKMRLQSVMLLNSVLYKKIFEMKEKRPKQDKYLGRGIP